MVLFLQLQDVVKNYQIQDFVPKSLQLLRQILGAFGAFLLVDSELQKVKLFLFTKFDLF